MISYEMFLIICGGILGGILVLLYVCYVDSKIDDKQEKFGVRKGKELN